MKKKEASARIKINHLLEEAGWRFFDDENGPANIQLEPNVKMSKADLTGLGENFDKVKNDPLQRKSALFLEYLQRKPATYHGFPQL